ncbi:MAG TPA: protein kinase [Gemmatimonadaceae bacterium]|nr:protein kinase [Gemmatimonadaceae bacterium]
MTELRSRLESSLGEAYRIERELGGGGMSHVFVAEEAALGRRVAVKVLRADLVAEISTERFRREILVAARLQHPHIVPVLTAGEIGGVPFYTMPFVSGESLDVRLAREGALPIREAARILAGIARALAYAHRAGVVHRDIKPGNVLVVDGTAMVTDFGIAKAIVNARRTDSGVQPDASRPQETLTAIGESVGTPAYMAPEQISADPGMDHRADIYSFGILAYEILAGRRPFTASGYQSLIIAHLTKSPQPLAEIRPEVPAELAQLVTECLRKQPGERPATADELVAPLDAFAAGHRYRGGARASSAPAMRTTDEQRAAAAVERTARPVVGRDFELAALTASFDRASHDRGLVHAIAGEPGLGKTTLATRFLEQTAGQVERCRVGVGRCSERLAGAEAYLPFLEALEGLLNGPDGALVAQEMREIAPAWYAQVRPATMSDPSGARTPTDARVGSAEQMKRQLGSFLVELTRSGRLVVCLEDVHWADASTVDLIVYLADRFDTLPMLLLVTYRPSDLLAARHPFADAALRLHERDRIRETFLRAFDRHVLGEYVDRAYESNEFPSEFVDLIFQRTEGTPLFVVDLMRQLADRGVIGQRDGSWRLERAADTVDAEIPQSIRSVIQRTIDRLDELDRRLLTIASVQGAQFDSAVVAGATGLPPEQVEEHLERLERVYAMVRLVEERVIGKRHPSLRYAFSHILYQNTLQSPLRGTRRMALSASVASVMHDLYGDDPAVAAELGVLHRAARQFGEAARCFLTAARTATRLFANKEAVLLARRGLDAAAAMPDDDERARIELDLQLALGVPLNALFGYSGSEVESAYSRARELSARFSDPATQIPALHGLYRFYVVSGRLHTARDVVEQLVHVAEATGDPRQIFIARTAMGPPLIQLGEFERGVEFLRSGMSVYDQMRTDVDRLTYGAFMPGAWLAIALWMLGDDALALEENRRAREHADTPFAKAYAVTLTAWLHAHRGDAELTKQYAEQSIEISRTHDFVQWRAVGVLFHSWSRVVLGDHDEALSTLVRALDGYRATQAEMNLPHYMWLLADAYHRTGKPALALDTLLQAQAVAEKNDNRCWEPELHRLRGEILRERGDRHGAEHSFQRALSIARDQNAGSLVRLAEASLAQIGL